MITTRTHRRGRHKAVEPLQTGRRRATVVAAGAAAAVLAGGGAAYAYWSTSGTGSGSAAASTMAAPTITAGTLGGELFPGATGGTLAVTASNPNPFPITVTLNPSTSAAGCTTPAITFSGGSFTLAAGASSVTKNVNNSVSMGDSSNDCQGKSLTVALTTSSQSN